MALLAISMGATIVCGTGEHFDEDSGRLIETVSVAPIESELALSTSTASWTLFPENTDDNFTCDQRWVCANVDGENGCYVYSKGVWTMETGVEIKASGRQMAGEGPVYEGLKHECQAAPAANHCGRGTSFNAESGNCEGNDCTDTQVDPTSARGINLVENCMWSSNNGGKFADFACVDQWQRNVGGSMKVCGWVGETNGSWKHVYENSDGHQYLFRF